jgi:hypothetical protein
MSTTTQATRERPILFSGEMVKALLDGRKTQTRRFIKPQPIDIIPADCVPDGCGFIASWCDKTTEVYEHLGCPHGQPGDRLWVKETWRPVGPWECREDGATIQYAADLSYSRKLGWPEKFRIKTSDRRDKWRPSIFMGRWASRITLEIITVRVERLQEISGKDAIAEGVLGHGGDESRAITEYMLLWEKINGQGSWAKNAMVWVIEFRKV